MSKPTPEAFAEAREIEQQILYSKHPATFVNWLAPRLDAFASRRITEKDAEIADLSSAVGSWRRSAQGFSAEIAVLDERIAALRALLLRAGDQICHYATDYPQPLALALVNDIDRKLARGHYSHTIPSKGDAE